MLAQKPEPGCPTFTSPPALDTRGRRNGARALPASSRGDHTETSPTVCPCAGRGAELLEETLASPDLLQASTPQGREAPPRHRDSA